MHQTKPETSRDPDFSLTLSQTGVPRDRSKKLVIFESFLFEPAWGLRARCKIHPFRRGSEHGGVLAGGEFLGEDGAADDAGVVAEHGGEDAEIAVKDLRGAGFEGAADRVEDE